LDHATCARIRATPEFAELERKRTAFGASLAVVMLVIYFGFIGLVAFAPALLATPVYGVITLGFPLGLFAIGLTAIYIVRANGEFEHLTSRILEAQR
jgi:uncharacterized membrane protein (DUF485 family)